MRNKINIIGISIISILSLLVPTSGVYAANVSVTETCNVQVYFKATVPDSVEHGKTFTVTNITVQPSATYGFNVTSSVFDMTATNTSSSTYSQDMYATNPSPTTGHNTYVGMYPNWTLDAAGPAGSAVTITLKRTVTVIQGYGGSPVTCNFTKVLASVPITAAAPAPAPSGQPSQPASPSKTSASSPTQVGVASASSGAATPSTAPSPSAQPTASASPDLSSTAAEPGEQSVSVVPLNIEVKDSAGKVVVGAEVTLDSGKMLTTNGLGRVVFSNVLTGTHAILVSYNGHKLTSNISLASADVGSVKSIQLPATSQPINPVIIGGAATATVGLGGAAGFLLLQRRRRLADANHAGGNDMSIQGIIDGLAVPTQANTPIEHIPAIPAFETKVATPTPAPWDPVSIALPPLAESAPEAAPAQVAPAAQPVSPAQLPQPEIEHFATPAALITAPQEAVTTQPAPVPEPAPAQPLEAVPPAPTVQPQPPAGVPTTSAPV